MYEPKTNIVERVLLIFWKYNPKVDSISKYSVIARKTITIGKSLKGGTKASNNLSSILLPVLDTKAFTLFTSILAITDLTNKEIITATKMIARSTRLRPNTPSLNTLIICKYKFRIRSI